MCWVSADRVIHLFQGVTERLSLLFYITRLRQVLFQGTCLMLAGSGMEIHKYWSRRPLGSKWIQGGNYSLRCISYIWPWLTLGHCIRWITSFLLSMKIITHHWEVTVFYFSVILVFFNCCTLTWKQCVHRLLVVCSLVSGVSGQVTQILTGFITHLHCGLQCTPHADRR